MELNVEKDGLLKELFLEDFVNDQTFFIKWAVP